MEVALPLILPNTFQHFCKWNVTHKSANKIGNVYRDKVTMDGLHNFITNTESTDIFDIKWQKWVERYNLQSNKWLQDLLHVRHKWYPPYLIDHFFIGMSTTQKSETMNHLVKMHTKPFFTIYIFVGSLEIILLGLRDKEMRKDNQDN